MQGQTVLVSIKRPAPSSVVPPCFLCFSCSRRRKKIVFRQSQRRWICLKCLAAFGGKLGIVQLLEKIPLAKDAIFPDTLNCCR
ncbi:hypothetical protein KKE06_02570 [Candidatus Micrarchaeota archaeon]|nr:hypothetical protein [Candidatus Micrarchaeota archaeon]MBU1929900.1 hypothetical protein [Candidatus Micrarchaeota archaeon]